MDPLLAGLDETQRKAVQSLSASVAVVGSAGTGKSTVLTRCFAAACRAYPEPERTKMAVSITAGGASQLRRMIARLPIKGGAHDPQIAVCCLHVLCDKLLRSELETDYTVLSLAESESLVKRLLSVLGVDRSTAAAPVVLKRISAAKGQCWTPTDLRAHAEGAIDHIAADVFVEYQRVLGSRRVLDVDDLLLETLKLFGPTPRPSASPVRWAYVAVDEDAPTRPLERLLIGHVLSRADRWCHAFDPALSSVDDGAADNPTGAGAGVHLRVRLDTNYRSSATIERATAVLSDRETLASRPGGSPIMVVRGDSPADEASRVVRLVVDAVDRGVDPSRMAIVGRTHLERSLVRGALADASVEAFDGMSSGQTLALNTAAQASLAYLRAVVNPHDLAAVAVALRYPRRGVGPKSLQRIEDAGGLIAASRHDPGLLHATARHAVHQFMDIIDRARSMAEHDVVAAADLVMEASGLRASLQREHTLESKQRARQSNALLVALDEWAGGSDGVAVLAGFTTAVAVGAVDLARGVLQRGIAVLSPQEVGLRPVDWVAVMGLAEGQWPKANVPSQGERQALYSVLGMAREELVLSYASSHDAPYGPAERPRSRFIDRLVSAGIDLQGPPGTHARLKAGGNAQSEPTTHEPGRVASEPIVTELTVDQLVYHAKLGDGIVRAVDNLGPRTIATIEFRRGESKRLVVAHARLRPGRSA